MLKRLIKILFYSLGLGIFVVIVIAGITQSKFFKDRLRAVIISYSIENLGGTLRLGRITGNFVTGFTIDSVKIYYENEIFLSTGKISLYHDPFSIIQKTITLRTVKIEEPIVHILKSHRNEWNINKIFRPDTSKPTGFDWTIKVEDLKIEKGNVVIFDSTVGKYVNPNDSSTKYLDYSHMEIKDFRLQLAATLKDKSYKAKIKNLSGYLTSPHLNLINLSGLFEMNEKKAEVKNLIITTKNSQFNIDASLNDVNIFMPLDLVNFKEKFVSVRLIADRIDLNELKTLIPDIYFLNGTVYANLDADGKFGNIDIKKLNVITQNSSIHLTGNISNLHEPQELYLDVKIDDSRIVPKDISELLKPFNIPEFPNVNKSTVFATYKGNPLDFRSTVHVQSNIGAVQAETYMNLKKYPMKYTSSFQLQGVNLSKLFDDENLNSSIFASGTIGGEGTDTETLDSKLNISIDSTHLMNQYFLKSNIAIQAKKSRFEILSNVQTSHMKIYGTGYIDISKNAIPKFGVEASLTSIDLSKVFNDENYKSSLTFHIRADGKGKEINTSDVELNIAVLPSVLMGHKISGEEIDVSLIQNNQENKSLRIKSNIADIELDGNFTLTEIFKIIPDGVKHFTNSIHFHLYQKPKYEYFTKFKPFDFNHSISVKDISTLAVVLGFSPSNFHGKLNGTLSNTGDAISFNGQIQINDFYYGRSGQGILINKCLLNYEIDSIGTKYQLNQMRSNLECKVNQLVINKTDLKNVEFNFGYNSTGGKIELYSTFDETNKATIKADIHTLPSSFALALSDINFSLDNYVWDNTKNSTLTIDSSGLRIEELLMNHNNTEVISIGGKISMDEKLDISATISNYQLNGLKYIFKNADLDSRNNQLIGLMNSEIHLRGDFQSPIIDLLLNANNVYFRNTHFDIIKATMDYSNRESKLKAELKSDTSIASTPDFTIVGNIPIDLSFKSVNDRFPEGQTNLNIISEGFKLNLLDPLIPAIDNLNGELICNISIKGTPKEPNYSGFIELKNTRFLLSTNNIYYNLSGKLNASVDKIVMQNFEIENERKDYSDGKMSLNGYFTLKDFELGAFDFKAIGKLLLLKEYSRQNLQNIYGRLIAKTGDEGLHYHGNALHSNISGTVSIEEANIVFPPTRSVAYTQSENIVRYIGVNDTIKLHPANDVRYQFYYQENYFDTLGLTESGQSRWWAGFTYDIIVESKGTTNIRMVFNPTTNEELYAELLGTVNVRRKAGKNSMVGEISISERSYYNFFKRFDASGKLKFLGEAENPELDILATYTGTRQPPTTNIDSIAAEQKVVIKLNIKGTRTEPNLKINITIDDKDYNEVITGSDMQSDAISFLFTNKFRDDLSVREKSDIVTSVGSTAGKSILAGATSTMLSGILTDFLRQEFNFIRSAEISYQGGAVQEAADLRLSGQMFNAYWRFGGKIFNDINNANVSFLLNFGDVFETARLKSLFLELERKVDGGEYLNDKKLTNSARIYYRWSF